MKPELYFDINSETHGGSLFRINDAAGTYSFIYHHSRYDVATDDIQVFQTSYTSFDDFWKQLSSDPLWFYLHPLFVHPEQRDFIQSAIKKADWKRGGNLKWQQSHQRQWEKVLNRTGGYYPQPPPK